MTDVTGGGSQRGRPPVGLAKRKGKGRICREGLEKKREASGPI
jgi:hypothetical protein